MQFITTDQRIAVENFEIGLIYTVTFTDGRYFLGACIGKGADFVMFQRTEPELIYCLNMTTAADIANIDPLGNDIGKILEYTGSVPTTIKTDGSPLLAYTIKGNSIPGTGARTANLLDTAILRNNMHLDPSTGLPVTYNNRVATSTFIDVAGISSVTISYQAITGSEVICMYSLFDEDTKIVRQTSIRTGAVIDVSSGNRLYLAWYASSGAVTIDLLSDIMLNVGSTPIPYVPYGYIISIISGDTTINTYIGTNPLRKSLDGTAVDELSSNGKLIQRVDTDGSILSTPIISYIDTPTIPTTDGLNIFDIDTTVKPSEVYIKYFSPLL